MTTVRMLLVFTLVLLTTSASAFADQSQHVVPTAQLAATVTDHAAAQDADRASLHEALARPQVRDVASTMGVDLSEADIRKATAIVHRLSDEAKGR